MTVTMTIAIADEQAGYIQALIDAGLEPSMESVVERAVAYQQLVHRDRAKALRDAQLAEGFAAAPELEAQVLAAAVLQRKMVAVEIGKAQAE
jgi:hypothetical protein